MQTLRLKWKDIIGNTSGRIMLSILFFTILLCGGFVVFTYHSKVNAHKEAEFKKLQGISKSLAAQLDGNAHQQLFADYTEEDDIYKTGQSDFYDHVNMLLEKVKKSNQLTSDIYTLVWNEDLECFEFGITSAKTPYFRHKWNNFSEEHIRQLDKGAAVGPYTDENGIWLSSFMPIKNDVGKTVALIQVDEPFDSFIAKTNKAVKETILILLFVLVCLTYIMLHIVQRLLSNADRIKKILHAQRSQIELKNKELLNSIRRAKIIQDSILPQASKIKEKFPEMFIMFEPKDIVSGDFYWYAEKDDYVYFAVADCTGHGVPGAFMSVMGHSILNDTVKHMSSPADILNCLDKELTQNLKENGGSSADGMDISLIRYCKKKNRVEFSGAQRPLIIISNKNIRKIPGDKRAIGNYKEGKKAFKNHQMAILPGDTIYMFSDGYYDQFGGANNKKYMSKNFRDFLLFANEHHIEDQKYLLQYEFHHWRDDQEQIDDVLVAGICFNDAA